MKFIVGFIYQKNYKIPVEAESYDAAHAIADLIIAESSESYLDDEEWFVPYIEKVVTDSEKCLESI
jgi:hypothetical protein